MREMLREFSEQSQYFGFVISVAAYLFGCWLRDKTRLAILNPLLISAVLVIAYLLGVGMDYDTYKDRKSVV